MTELELMTAVAFKLAADLAEAYNLTAMDWGHGWAPSGYVLEEPVTPAALVDEARKAVEPKETYLVNEQPVTLPPYEVVEVRMWVVRDRNGRVVTTRDNVIEATAVADEMNGIMRVTIPINKGNYIRVDYGSVSAPLA